MCHRQRALRRGEIHSEFAPKSLTGDIRCPPAARLPRASRPLRAAVAQQPPRRQHRATVPVAKLPAQRLCENQAAQPRQDKSQARPSCVGPGPQSCAASPGALQRFKVCCSSSAQRAPAFLTLRYRSGHLPLVGTISALPRSVAPASLRSTLSRCGVIVRPLLRSAGGIRLGLISSGFLEKIIREVARL